jgi:hypothetical protein
MFRFPRGAAAPIFVRGSALGLFATLETTSNAAAHCFVGQRFLPATLAIDDPCVADEMSLPTLTYSKTGDVPPAAEVDIEGDFSKRITEDFGITIAETWSQFSQPGSQSCAGFGDLDTTFQYQLRKDGPHELALLLGLIVDWGGTGATNAGIGTSYSTLTPTFYFGKGLGDEAQFTTPAANNFGNSSVTTGTIQPDVTWVGNYYQVGVEAVIPVSSQSGSTIGVMAQLHLYLDDLFPTTLGQPLIGKSAPPQLPFGG